MLLVGPLVGAVVVGLAAALAGLLPGTARQLGAARVTAVTGTVAAVVLWLLLTAATQDTWLVYGRSLNLTDAGRTTFQGMFLLLAALYLLTWVWPAGRDFVPTSLAAVAPLAAMVMIRPFTLGALFLPLAVALLVMAMQSGRHGDAAAGWRYLVMTVLALPLFLLAGWLTATPAALSSGAARVLAVAIAITVGGFPFYMWVRPAARQGSPLLRPFLFGGAQLAVMAFLFGWLGEAPGWQADPVFQSWLRWSGLLTALLGGLLAAMAADGEELLSSLLLLDMGVGLLALLLPGTVGWQTAAAIHAGRSVGLLLVGVGWLWLSGGDKLGRWQRPLAMGLWVYGCLSLVGLPLTPGFNGRWALLSALGSGELGAVWLPLWLLAAMAGGLWGVWRTVGRGP